MLRNIIPASAVVLFAGALLLFLLHPEQAALLAISGVVLLGTVFERVGYGRPDETPPLGPAWQETAERFVDPSTGRVIAVWFDPGDGARRYVDDGAAPPLSDA